MHTITKSAPLARVGSLPWWVQLFGCFLCVLLFVVFVSFAFLLVCARSRQLDSFMDYVKVHTSSLLWLFMHINSISGKLKLV